MLTKAPRGTKDITPKDSYKWNYVESKFKEVCSLFGYEEIRTPIFEHTELFQRGVGETTDVVQKEMYSFTDKEAYRTTKCCYRACKQCCRQEDYDA